MQKNLPAGGPILDIGCGSGHYAGHLATAGFQVLGIDLDPVMIKTAGDTYPAARFQVENMLDIHELTGPFAAAYCIGNVLPHLPAEELPRFLGRLHRILAPDGVWLVQTVNFDPILKREHHRFPEIAFEAEQLVFHREYSKITGEHLRFATRLEQGGRPLFTDQVDLYPLTSTELIERHRQAGLIPLGHWADFGGTPYLAEKDSGSVYIFRNRIG